MKKVLTLLLALLVVGTMLTGCSKTESPIDVFRLYAGAWENRDFAAMYSYISTADKAAISQAQFEAAYRDFYDSLGVESIHIEALADEEDIKARIKKADPINLPANVQLNTDLVDKSYDIQVKFIKDKVDDKEAWRLEWDYSLIYENHAQGDNVKAAFTSMPVRGEILDCKGEKLAENGSVVQVGIVPGRLGDMKDEIIGDLSETFNISEQYINDRLDLSWVRDDTFVDLIKIPRDKIAEIETIHGKNNGATYMVLDERVYPYAEIIAHLVGYLGYVNDEELAELEGLGFDTNTRIGRTGLEGIFDEHLRGRPGRRVVIVDKDGEEKELLIEQETEEGQDLQLTIDIDVQTKLYNEMSGDQGTAASMDYKTGELLALVNSPSYDPNKFILGISSDELKSIQEAEGNPLLNRFTNVYSPGSTLKPVTAAIALDEGLIDSRFTIDIEGLQWQKDASWGNYHITRVTDPGMPVDLEKAMVYSDNIYFGQVALKLGAQTFIDRAKDFGIGESLDLRYGVSISQLAAENKITNEVLLADTGYGQGEVLLNIVNLPKAFSPLVNGGSIVNPKLIPDGLEPELIPVIGEDVADEVFDLILKVVEDSNGTGHRAYIPGKTIAGKTGTAQVPGAVAGEIDELGWFIAIDKDEETPYITAMMLEDVQGRGGSRLSIERVRDFIIAYSSN
ncbi:MAG TPA: penicillin-binding transpeptidase domain-containing protein [Bacillota bacterium]|nr:penicillin-binding transpeptidase domain-containing protein [Bacillota bacterium]